MPRDQRIPTTGRIVEILENGCFRAELPNGKIVFAFPGKSFRHNSGRIPGIGERIALNLTPFDFSKAEITGLENL